MATYTKEEAMRLAKEDFSAGRFEACGYIFEVWGGTTKYVATERGVERVKRHDSGGTKGLKRADILVVPADRLAAK